MKYNNAQSIAVNHDKGPMLVIAGPGSGKTAVITGRTLNLCEQLGVNPINILVITFTKAAAVQMKNRFDAVSKGSYSAVSFGTFHSVFFTILKSVYNYQSSNILREEDRYVLIKGLLEKYNIEYEDEKEMIGLLSSEISLVKGEMISVDTYCSANISAETFRRIYMEYNQTLCDKRLIDFDDMLIRCYHLLKTNKEALKVWQSRFKYILVDEFQDINLVQYLTIKMLAAPENNLFIVGDDDQSIYSFRGAKPEIMLGFEKDYPDARKVTLDVNYRCSEAIVKASGRVISNNINRFHKDIKTSSKYNETVGINEFKNVHAQYDYVAKDIIKKINEGMRFSQIAVLFRTNTQARGMAAKLMEYNIAFSVRESIPDIYEHFIAKDMFSYIRCGCQIADKTTGGRFDRGDFLRIVNKPNRYISREALGGTQITFNDLCGFYQDKSWMVDRIMTMFSDLKNIGGMDPYAAINYIRNKIGYDDYLKDYAAYRKIDFDELMDTLEELMESAKGYDSLREWESYIEKYRNNMKAQMDNNSKNAVSLMTFHSSKGLEWEGVYIIDANEGITPHNKSKTPTALAEERRMFYVAMTRAKRHLTITYALERFNKDLGPSRFLGEIYVSKSELVKGSTVNHKVYGEGKIIDNDGKKIKVLFERDKAIKIFDIDYCISTRIIKV